MSKRIHPVERPTVAEFETADHVAAQLVLNGDKLSKCYLALRAESRWVPAGERLPEQNVGVWVCYKGKPCWAAWRLCITGEWSCAALSNEYRKGDHFSHWMPIATSPEIEAT